MLGGVRQARVYGADVHQTKPDLVVERHPLAGLPRLVERPELIARERREVEVAVTVAVIERTDVRPPGHPIPHHAEKLVHLEHSRLGIFRAARFQGSRARIPDGGPEFEAQIARGARPDHVDVLRIEGP